MDDMEYQTPQPEPTDTNADSKLNDDERLQQVLVVCNIIDRIYGCEASTSEKAVMMFLSNRRVGMVVRDGADTPMLAVTMREMSESLGLTIGTLIRGVKRLEERGLLGVTRTSDGRRQSNVYELFPSEPTVSSDMPVSDQPDQPLREDEDEDVRMFRAFQKWLGEQNEGDGREEIL